MDGPGPPFTSSVQCCLLFQISFAHLFFLKPSVQQVFPVLRMGVTLKNGRIKLLAQRDRTSKYRGGRGASDWVEGTLKALKENKFVPLHSIIKLRASVYSKYLIKYWFFPVVKQKYEHTMMKTRAHYGWTNAFFQLKTRAKPSIKLGRNSRVIGAHHKVEKYIKKIT